MVRVHSCELSYSWAVSGGSRLDWLKKINHCSQRVHSCEHSTFKIESYLKEQQGTIVSSMNASALKPSCCTSTPTTTTQNSDCSCSRIGSRWRTKAWERIGTRIPEMNRLMTWILAGIAQNIRLMLPRLWIGSLEPSEIPPTLFKMVINWRHHGARCRSRLG